MIIFATLTIIITFGMALLLGVMLAQWSKRINDWVGSDIRRCIFAGLPIAIVLQIIIFVVCLW